MRVEVQDLSAPDRAREPVGDRRVGGGAQRAHHFGRRLVVDRDAVLAHAREVLVEAAWRARSTAARSSRVRPPPSRRAPASSSCRPCAERDRAEAQRCRIADRGEMAHELPQVPARAAIAGRQHGVDVACLQLRIEIGERDERRGCRDLRQHVGAGLVVGADLQRFERLDARRPVPRTRCRMAATARRRAASACARRTASRTAAARARRACARRRTVGVTNGSDDSRNTGLSSPSAPPKLSAIANLPSVTALSWSRVRSPDSASGMQIDRRRARRSWRSRPRRRTHRPRR